MPIMLGAKFIVPQHGLHGMRKINASRHSRNEQG